MLPLPRIEQAMTHQLSVIRMSRGNVKNPFHSSRFNLIIVFDRLCDEIACGISVKKGNLFVESHVERKGVFLLHLFHTTANREQKVQPLIVLHEIAYILKNFSSQM